MTILDADRVRRFKIRLFQKNVSLLMQKGGHGLQRVGISKHDANDNLLIPIQKIVDFFLKAVEEDELLSSKMYFSNLHTLFDEFSKEINDYCFESCVSVPEKEIQESDKKTIIKHLSKNLIITYFNNIKLASGDTNRELLDKDLKKIIKISTSGRAYQTLVENTFNNLVKTLKQQNKWQECIKFMNEADLVCRLVGVRLPQIDKTVLSKFIVQFRTEITKENVLLSKILKMKNQLLQEETDQKQNLKSMEKLDTATKAVLIKIDNYFIYAHSFIQILGTSPKIFLGKIDDSLKENLANLFLGNKGVETKYSINRFYLNKLFNYPELTIYSRAFQNHEIYQKHYLNFFKLYYGEILNQMNNIALEHIEDYMENLNTCLFECNKLLENLGLDEKFLNDEKSAVRKEYIALIKTAPVEQTTKLLKFADDISLVTQNTSKDFFEIIKNTLEDSCFSALEILEIKSFTMDNLKKNIQKILLNYSLYHRPQRSFYQKFFEKFVGIKNKPPSAYFEKLIETNKHIALAMLKVFSDRDIVTDILSKSQIEYAENLLENINK